MTHEQNLKRLLKHLRTRTAPRTARQIAKSLGWCKPTVYALVRELQGRGEPISSRPEQRRGPGPVAAAYEYSGPVA